jgi:hypothetical protein
MNTIGVRLIHLKAWLSQLSAIMMPIYVLFYTVVDWGLLYLDDRLYKDRPIALQLRSLGHTIIDNVDIASVSVRIR